MPRVPAIGGPHDKATSKGKTVPTQLRAAWYDDDVHDVSAEARNLLNDYSGIRHDEVVSHALKLRDLAFDRAPYACIGQMRFLLYNLRLLPFHDRIVSRLKSGATFIDAGCCFGQELRYLIHAEHIPPAQLFGFDLEPIFIDLGFQLFRDKDRLGGHFIQGDVFAQVETPEGEGLAAFNGKIDVVFCSSFLHVWPWDEMVTVVKRLVVLTAGREHAIICGKQLASREAGHYPMPNAHGLNYRHNEKSMARLWEQVSRETGTGWAVESGFYSGDVELSQNREHAWSEPNQGMLWFCATKN